MLKNISYPDVTDEEFQNKIYQKREFYYNRMPKRKEYNDYKDIQKYRDGICGGTIKLQAQQSFLSNYINPNTPFHGVLIYHGVGTGKCVHPDSIVWLNFKNIRIEDVWKNHAYHVIKDNDNDEWASLDGRYLTKSINYLEEEVFGLVTRLYRQRVNTTLVTIELENNTKLTMTKNHMLYTLNNKWTNMYKVGDMVLVEYKKWASTSNVNGFSIVEYIKWLKIISITYEEYNGYVYDLEVKTHHNYIANGIVTHNTCAAISICENFKNIVKKYNTKMYILVPGPLNKESWKNELIKCTKETYYNDLNNTVGYVDQSLKQKQEMDAKAVALQYYKIMSHRGFYKKVLGHKITDTKKSEAGKKVFKKTEDGEYERDISIDKIEQLDNTILVVDEAHNITGNEYGMALQKVINNSKNLRVILLTATPMKNLADDIVELINYMRPKDDPILREKIFTSDKNHLMEIKPNGLEYLKKMTQGYVSHYRGMDPLTFAIQIDEGEIPDGLLFTPIIRCTMNKFQYEAYKHISDTIDDALERKSAAVANFAFPGLDNNKKLTAYSGREGITTLKNQLKSNSKQLLETIKNAFFEKDNVNINNILGEDKTITGLIFKQPYLKNFSTKFDKCLSTIMELVEGKKGAGTAFIYSNLVKSGIELFEQVLLQNGCLEYREDGIYSINNDTKDALLGITYKEFKTQNIQRKFYPMTYITITGQSEETKDINTEIKSKILYQVFNKIDNVDGKQIKFVLGSKVMNEGITLENVKEVHILDVYFNLGKVYQVIGRAIRHCVHYQVTSERNPFPKVNVYRYTVALPDSNTLSSEEQLYIRAEKKYMLIKKVERAIKEVAIDCPLNYNGNVYPEEVKKYKGCKDTNTCPAICDFEECDYKCNDKTLNLKYYDNTTNLYKKILKKDLDYSTFSNNLAKNEIDQAKEKIKQLYRIKYVYTLDDIIQNVYESLDEDKKDLFDTYFVYKALNDLLPITENDFNNYDDTIYDKYNVPGYLIYRDKYYIFQPFNENEDVVMFYRTTYQNELTNEISIQQYIEASNIKLNVEENAYNFDMEYYEKKADFIYVGIIDKESSKKRLQSELDDVFKLRPMREKNLLKKRDKGLPSLKGAVCYTSKDKTYLFKIAESIGIKNLNKITRFNICEIIKQRLLYLEKYSSKKDNNKYTYMIIPTNHKVYPFPYNLEDRVDSIKNKLTGKIDVNKEDNGIFEGTRNKTLARYILTTTTFEKNMEELGFIKTDKGYKLVIE